MDAAEAHGPRISDDEFDRRIVALYSSFPASPTRAERRQIRRTEFELSVAHRLGTRFPADRLDALWRVQERVERRRLALMAWSLIGSLFPRVLSNRAQGVASYLVREYGRVLTPDELRTYFGDEEVRNPGLPDDRPG